MKARHMKCVVYMNCGNKMKFQNDRYGSSDERNFCIEFPAIQACCSHNIDLFFTGKIDLLPT